MTLTGGEIETLLRRAGFFQALVPKERIQLEQDVRQTLMRGGGIVPEAAVPFRSPLVMHWLSGSSPMQRAANAGHGSLLAAYAETPPSGDYCTVNLIMATEFEGASVVGQCFILPGHHIGEITLGIDIPAGAWLKGVVAEANGASDVSISLTIKLA